MFDWITWKLSIDLSISIPLIYNYHGVLPNNNIDEDENEEWDNEEYDSSSGMQCPLGESLEVQSDWSPDVQDAF